MDISEKLEKMALWQAANGTRERFLYCVDAYKEVTGVSDKTFGYRAASDTGIITRIRGGGNCTIDKLDICRYFMATSLTETQLKMFNQLTGAYDEKTQK